MGQFQRDCKYDGDKPMDGQQEQDGSFDSYDPVVGKWMTNLIATNTHYCKGYEKSIHSVEQTKRLKKNL